MIAMDFIGSFIDDHPWIASIIVAIIVLFVFAAVLGLITFVSWLNGISKIASTIVIMFLLLVIYIRCIITS